MDGKRKQKTSHVEGLASSFITLGSSIEDWASIESVTYSNACCTHLPFASSLCLLCASSCYQSLPLIMQAENSKHLCSSNSARLQTDPGLWPLKRNLLIKWETCQKKILPFLKVWILLKNGWMLIKACYIAQRTLLNTLSWPMWEKNLKKTG